MKPVLCELLNLHLTLQYVQGEIIVKSLDNLNSFSSNWQFALLELAGSHYAAVCMEKDEAVEGKNLIFTLHLGVKHVHVIVVMVNICCRLQAKCLLQ